MDKFVAEVKIHYDRLIENSDNEHEKQLARAFEEHDFDITVRSLFTRACPEDIAGRLYGMALQQGQEGVA